MSNLEQERRQLLQEMKVTKGSRFNATERLRARDRGRTYITSTASVIVIALTVLPLTFHLPDWFTALLNFLTILMSITFLVFSLLQYSSGDLVTADQHHRCALEINALRRKLRIAEGLSEDALERHAEQYDSILNRYSSNHEPVDFDLYKKEHPAEYPTSEENKEIIDKYIRKNSEAERFIQKAVTSLGLLVALSTALIALMSSLGEEGVNKFVNLFIHWGH